MYGAPSFHSALNSLEVGAKIAESRAKSAERAGFTTLAATYRNTADTYRAKIVQFEQAGALSGFGAPVTTSGSGGLGCGIMSALSWGLGAGILGAIVPGFTFKDGFKYGAIAGAALGVTGLSGCKWTQTINRT